MTETYKNKFETEEGRAIEKEPVVAVALADAEHSDRWDGGGYVRAIPITLQTTTYNRDNSFGAPAGSLADNERFVGSVSVNGMWKVWWLPPRDSEYDITHLGYEYEGATCYNWDWVIQRVKDDDSRW